MIEAATPVATWDALQTLGFEPDPKVYSEQQAGLSCDFGSFQLTAGRMMNLEMRETWQFSGVVATPRTVAMIDFEMPLQVESVEQCAAWIAWHLQRDLPSNEKLVARAKQSLVILGLQHQAMLPWVRRQAEYAARPQCDVERSWMRQAFKALAGHISTAGTAGMVDKISIRFDGAVLSFHGQGWTVPVPASGTAWPDQYEIKIGDFNKFPARLMQTEVGVSIWEGKLTIGKRLYRGIAIAGPSASPKQNSLFEHQP